MEFYTQKKLLTAKLFIMKRLYILLIFSLLVFNLQAQIILGDSDSSYSDSTIRNGPSNPPIYEESEVPIDQWIPVVCILGIVLAVISINKKRLNKFEK